MSPTSQMLDRLLDPVSHALGPEAARRLVGLRGDAQVQQRIDDLADRANEGQLTTEERSEYDALITAATVLGILQSKARAVLDSHPDT